ncbi:MAG: hypothetical protein FJX71_04785 [Alphaproteobacteria bacterium]|nr:hypothetical protein [Alphaproteobacteria bacterium]
MSTFPHIASELLFDTDQERLYETTEIASDTVWISARVYKSSREKLMSYEVWVFEWFPVSNEEKYKYIQSFKNFEDAKNFAQEILTNKLSDI